MSFHRSSSVWSADVFFLLLKRLSCSGVIPSGEHPACNPQMSASRTVRWESSCSCVLKIFQHLLQCTGLWWHRYKCSLYKNKSAGTLGVRIRVVYDILYTSNGLPVRKSTHPMTVYAICPGIMLSKRASEPSAIITPSAWPNRTAWVARVSPIPFLWGIFLLSLSLPLNWW